jgi:hypothetical protein
VSFATKFEKARLPLVIGLLAMSGMALGGCMSSPTYGTDKTSGEQFVDDITGILSLGPKKHAKIDYKPRPELVKPETTAVLPPPQDSVTTASNSAWPESPEQRLARIRSEATANQDNAAYRPLVDPDVSMQAQPIVPAEGPDADKFGRRRNPTQQREDFKKALAEQNSSGVVTTRKYLSDPPLVYREPAATAPINDIGEDEWKKERDAKRAARSDKENAGSVPLGRL